MYLCAHTKWIKQLKLELQCSDLTCFIFWQLGKKSSILLSILQKNVWNVYRKNLDQDSKESLLFSFTNSEWICFVALRVQSCTPRHLLELIHLDINSFNTYSLQCEVLLLREDHIKVGKTVPAS